MRARAALALLLLAASARAAPDDWFRAYQYASHPSTLRGCSECQGERDDVCDVPAGVLAQPLDEYARGRWPAAGRLKLLRSKADPDCAVAATGPKGFFAAHVGVEIAAVRLSRAPPSPALTARFADAGAVPGWPVAPPRRKTDQAIRAQARRAAVRLSVVCWPSEQGWPSPAMPGADARSDLGSANSCELWLLSVKPQTGEPDIEGVSFPVTGAFAAGDPRWRKAFDRAAALDESLVLGDVAAPHTASASAEKPVEAASPPPAPGPCGDGARKKTATLERFEQWEAQVLGTTRSSLDRDGWTLNAAAWSGHCQEMDVLRAALEQQLACTVARKGSCLLANGQPATGDAAGSR
ncbi:MAG: hypothetical protein ACJ78T_18100 [Myxococcales bacterium]